MITVQTTPRGPVRVDLEPLVDGMSPDDQAHILFKPLTTPGKAVGRGSVREMILGGAGQDVAAVAFTVAAARWGLLSWNGVGDNDGHPIEATADHLGMLLEQREDIFDLVDRHYVLPALEQEQEKNGSAPSQRGTSPASGTAAAPATAGHGAGGNTAAPARRPAKRVPTKSKSRKRK